MHDQLPYDFAPDQQNQHQLSQSQSMTDGQSEMRDQLPSDFIYQEMFAAFDIDGSGAIEKDDLETAAKSMGWSKSQGKLF